MTGWTLCFVLLLPLTVCFDSEVTLVKTLSSTDVTPICTNETVNIITLIVCKISTERSRGEVCRLLYYHGKDFEHGCDSRFTLMTENQTVFLHLTSLTPEDSGNYSCECSSPDGTNILHLSITVEEEENIGRTIAHALMGVTVIIIMTAVILGFIYRRLRHGRELEALSSQPNRELQDIEPYSTFIRRESGLYSTVKMQHSNINTNNSNVFGKDGSNSANFL